MTEEHWQSWHDPCDFLRSLLYQLHSTFAKAFTGRRLRLFAAACCRNACDHWQDDRTACAVAAAEAFVNARTNSERQRLGVVRKKLFADKDWIQTVEGRMARAAVSKNEFDAAIKACWYAGQLSEITPSAVGNGRLRLGPLLRDIVGNPFRPSTLDTSWRTSTVVALALAIYESNDFGPMPVLADALEEAGCNDPAILGHCRDPNGTHVRGCWVVDLVLGKA